MCSAKAAALLMLAVLAGCTTGSLFSSQPEPPAPPPPPPAPPPPAPPPVDLAGRWRLSASPGRACVMNFADTAGPPAASPAPGAPGAPPPPPIPGSGLAFALQGTIAPEGGCPGNFFTSRKWTFEHGMLVIRDFKNQPLAQLSYAGDHFEAEDANGKLILSR